MHICNEEIANKPLWFLLHGSFHVIISSDKSKRKKILKIQCRVAYTHNRQFKTRKQQTNNKKRISEYLQYENKIMLVSSKKCTQALKVKVTNNQQLARTGLGHCRRSAIAM